MSDKFRNKYRIASHRLSGWDYSGNGYYFITLVTQNRECNLGNIIDGNMILSDFGKIVNAEWLKSFEIRVELLMDTYIIMPNHLHAIVVLDKTEKNDMDGLIGTDDMDGLIGIDGMGGAHVEAHGRASLQSIPQSENKLPFIRKPKSISSFIGGFKSAVNSKIDDFIDKNNLGIPKYNRNNHFFQSNYYDHIIRNANEYQRIKNYIINNPSNWEIDKFHL